MRMSRRMSGKKRAREQSGSRRKRMSRSLSRSMSRRMSGKYRARAEEQSGGTERENE
jgi:hypothetical protein